MSDVDLLDFPLDFLHIQYNKAVEFAVLNIPSSHRTQQLSSSSTISNNNEVIVIDDADDFEMDCCAEKCPAADSSVITTTVGFDKKTLTLGFDFANGRFVDNDVKDHSKPHNIKVPKNSAKFLK